MAKLIRCDRSFNSGRVLLENGPKDGVDVVSPQVLQYDLTREPLIAEVDPDNAKRYIVYYPYFWHVSGTHDGIVVTHEDKVEIQVGDDDVTVTLWRAALCVTPELPDLPVGLGVDFSSFSENKESVLNTCPIKELNGQPYPKHVHLQRCSISTESRALKVVPRDTIGEERFHKWMIQGKWGGFDSGGMMIIGDLRVARNGTLSAGRRKSGVAIACYRK